MNAGTAADAISDERTWLGIELGSTRIKACLIGPEYEVLAAGSSAWENEYVDGGWTYSLDAVWAGLQNAVASLLADCDRRHGVRPTRFGGLGVSAMMHGYLAFDEAGELLVPFRTWRNTSTGTAAADLSERFGFNIPLRWSVAHYYQAILDGEPHVSRVAFLTTLAGYVHWRLTGRRVIGIGDASGMFPIDATTGTYDESMLATFDELAKARGVRRNLVELLPQVLAAGEAAGSLTDEGAKLLDSGSGLRAGIPLCPPEGDAGTGMVATNAVAPRTGNVSAGTSIFAMVVLEKPLGDVHSELDIVATPAGIPVAMVHCNNGFSELDAWASLLGEFSAGSGHAAAKDDVFEIIFRAALSGESDGGGLLAYNYLSGEPITGLDAGRPLVVRTPDSRLTLANFARSLIYGAFGTLSIGMQVLAAEGVRLDGVFAHGGVFRTAGVAQRFLAAAIGVPVAVGATAGEGGAWGMALLAAYLDAREEHSLADYLATRVFAGAETTVVAPEPADVSGYAIFLDRYRAGLAIERAAITAL